jgi:ATP-dependent Clp protease ATP-binding subunit ClpA
MDLTLHFYEKDDYYDFKETKISEGYFFESITKFIHNTIDISDIDVEKLIVDISAITEYINIQSVTEQVVGRFEISPFYICDISKKEKIEYELRFAFENLKNLDKDSFIKKKKEKKTSELDEVQIVKQHKKITDLSDDELDIFLHEFNSKLYGHEKFKNDFAQQLRSFRIFNKLGENKILSFFLMGDSGVGKTEVARTIFNCLNGKKRLAKINFGNYSSEFSLSSLIGASRGYRDSEDGEIFMKVRDTDIGVLLIDEFEKSNATLFNYFLNVLETGLMESSLGGQIDLNGFIIIFTSNISKENFKEKISPELRSRFDYKGIFTLLSNTEKRKYIEFRSENISKKIKTEYGYEFGEELKQYLLNNIKIETFKNMRNINREIKKMFLLYLANQEQNNPDSSDLQSLSIK